MINDANATLGSEVVCLLYLQLLVQYEGGYRSIEGEKSKHEKGFFSFHFYQRVLDPLETLAMQRSFERTTRLTSNVINALQFVRALKNLHPGNLTDGCCRSVDDENIANVVLLRKKTMSGIKFYHIHFTKMNVFMNTVTKAGFVNFSSNYAHWD